MTGTFDMVQDLDGFLYGPHAIVSWTSLTEGLAPDEMEIFDDKVHEHMGFSTYSLLSLTECGIQTGASLLRRYKKLDEKLTARGVPRPILEMTDNHVSRYDNDVMDYCKSVDILQWSERLMTSGIFQALDQNNAACHLSYKKGKQELKQNHAVALSHDHARRVKAGEINGLARTFHTSRK